MTAGDDVKVSASAQTSTPEVGGKRPYHIVLLADLAADDRLARLTPVDKQDFAAVMSRAAPAAAIALKDPFGGGADWEFRLTFASMQSLGPAGLLAQVPGARERLALRERIVERQGGKIGAADLERAIQSAAETHASFKWVADALQASGGDAGGSGEGGAAPASTGSSLLDMVESPGEQDVVAADIERVAASAGDKNARIGGGEAGRLRAIVERIDAELTAIADALYKHPDVRRIERAWRGVKLLVDRIDFREGPRLSLLHTTRETAIDRFIDEVIDPAFEGDIPTPGLVLFDFPITAKPPDIALLDQLAQHAAGLPVPVSVPIDANFFNVPSIPLIKNLPNLAGFIDSYTHAKWRALRDEEYSKAIMPVLGNFVLRAPFDGDGARKGEFAYRQTVKTVNDLLWTGGHLAMGVCAARSYASYGWPTRMFGIEAGKLEDLPVVANPKDPNAPFGPGDAMFPDRRVNEFPDIGMSLLHTVKGRDYCILLGGVSMRRPVKTADNDERQAMMEVSTPYQMFSALVADRLCETRPMLQGLTAEQIQANLVLGLRNLIGLSDTDDADAVAIATTPSPDNPREIIVAVRITPPATVAPGGLAVEMCFTVAS